MRARVVGGRLAVNTPCELPEGTELDLVVADESDDLDDEEKAAPDDALRKSWSQYQAGESRPAEAILDELKTRR